MVAQAAKLTTKTIIRKPRKGSKSEAILTLTATTPATPPEIAETVNTSRQLVHQVLDRYGVEPNTIESFKKYRADILAGKQEIILRSIDEEAIKEMPVGQRVMSLGILYDKERIERGLSDDNTRPMVVIQIKGNAEVNVDNPVNNTSCQPPSQPIDIQPIDITVS